MTPDPRAPPRCTESSKTGIRPSLGLTPTVPAFSVRRIANYITGRTRRKIYAGIPARKVLGSAILHYATIKSRRTISDGNIDDFNVSEMFNDITFIRGEGNFEY